MLLGARLQVTDQQTRAYLHGAASITHLHTHSRTHFLPGNLQLSSPLVKVSSLSVTCPLQRMHSGLDGPVVGVDGAGVRVTGACGCAPAVTDPIRALSVSGFSMPRMVNVDKRGPGDRKYLNHDWWKQNTAPGFAPIYSPGTSESGGKEMRLAGYGFYWICWREGQGVRGGSGDSADGTTPVIVWVNGGPGASSLFGMFAENGPALVNASGDGLVENPHAWTRVAHVIYVDAPLGTGFSHSIPGREALAATTSMQYAQMVRQVLVHVAQRYRGRLRLLDADAPAPLYITGESYGGKYVPAIVDALLDGEHRGEDGKKVVLKPTGMLIVDGFMAPVATGQAYAPYARWALENGAFRSDPEKRQALRRVRDHAISVFGKDESCVSAACRTPLLGAPHSQLMELGATSPGVAAAAQMRLPSPYAIALAARASQSGKHQLYPEMLDATLGTVEPSRCNRANAAALTSVAAQAVALAAPSAPGGAVRAAKRSCEGALSYTLGPLSAANVDPYFIMGSATGSAARITSVSKLLSSASWRRRLGLSDLDNLPERFCKLSSVVNDRFIDFAQDASALIQAALNRGVRVQMWNGDSDLLVPWLGTVRVANCLPYMAQKRKFSKFTFDGDQQVVAAQHRKALSVVVFHNAGHEVPMYQPASALAQVREFMGMPQAQTPDARADRAAASAAGGCTMMPWCGAASCTARAKTAVAVGALVAGAVSFLVLVIIVYFSILRSVKDHGCA